MGSSYGISCRECDYMKDFRIGIDINNLFIFQIKFLYKVIFLWIHLNLFV